MGMYLLEDLYALGIVGSGIGKCRRNLYSVVIPTNSKS
jgi:hypothetical protein